jgi:hypothetical protein
MEFHGITPFQGLFAFFLQGEPSPLPPDAVIVRLMPPPSDLETLRDILIGSLGLGGALAVTGILLGIVLGGVVFCVRRYRSA